jgi:hypothetical protein
VPAAAYEEKLLQLLFAKTKVAEDSIKDFFIGFVSCYFIDSIFCPQKICCYEF